MSLTYVWTVDGNPLLGDGEDGAPACQLVTCIATPSDGTVEGVPSEATVSVGSDTVLALDGVSPAILESTVTPHVPNGAFTGEVWVRLDEVEETVVLEWVDTYAPGGTGFALWVTPGGQPAVVVMSPSQSQVFLEATDAVLQPNIWTHIAVTFADGFTRLWKDGEVVGVAAGVDFDLASGGPLDLRLGGSTLTSVNAMSGALDDIRLSLADRYGTAAFAPADEFGEDLDTWMLLDFDGGSGNIWLDQTSGLTLTVPQGAGSVVGEPCSP